jgi:hypothetical protein
MRGTLHCAAFPFTGYPAARQLLYSLKSYMLSPSFHPVAEMSAQEIDGLMK